MWVFQCFNVGFSHINCFLDRHFHIVLVHLIYSFITFYLLLYTFSLLLKQSICMFSIHCYFQKLKHLAQILQLELRLILKLSFKFEYAIKLVQHQVIYASIFFLKHMYNFLFHYNSLIIKLTFLSLKIIICNHIILKLKTKNKKKYKFYKCKISFDSENTDSIKLFFFYYN